MCPPLYCAAYARAPLPPKIPSKVYFYALLNAQVCRKNCEHDGCKPRDICLPTAQAESGERDRKITASTTTATTAPRSPECRGSWRKRSCCRSTPAGALRCSLQPLQGDPCTPAIDQHGRNASSETSLPLQTSKSYLIISKRNW